MGWEIIRLAIALVRTVAEGRCCNLASERGEDPDSLDIKSQMDGLTVFCILRCILEIAPLRQT